MLKNNRALSVAFCVNQRFFTGVLISILCLIRSCLPQSKLSIVIIDAGLDESSRQKLSEICQEHGVGLRFCVGDDGMITSSKKLKKDPSFYLRLALPVLLDEPQTFYLDADLLIFEDLTPISHFRSENHFLFSAVQDFETKSLTQDSPELARSIVDHQEMGYFNAGVVNMNLDLLRKENFTARAFEFLSTRESMVRFADQSAMNFLAEGRWQSLPSRWNSPAWLFDRRNDLRLPAIMHFTNSAPWLVRTYTPSQALFERVAFEFGVVLPKPEVSLCRSCVRSFGVWLVAPGRVGLQFLRAILGRLLGKQEIARTAWGLAGYWIEYFMNGPKRVLRYRRCIRKIKSRNFDLFKGCLP